MKRFLGLILLFGMFACEEDDYGELKYPNILGRYTLTEATSSWSETFPNGNSTPYGENLMNDCSRNEPTRTILELKRNGTFEHVSYDSSDCSSKTIRTGTWKVTYTFVGYPNGEMSFDDSPEVYSFHGSSIEGQPGTEIYYFRTGYKDYEQTNPNIAVVYYNSTYRRIPD